MSSTVVSSKLYDIMCLPQFSSIAEVRSSYKTLALKYHPDKNLGDPEAANKFRVVKEAYELLSDEAKKKKYDLRLQMAMRTATTSKNAAQSPSSLSSTYKAFFQMNNLSPTRRQRRTDTSAKGRGSATGTASRGPAAASTNPTAPSGSTPGYSTNDGTRSRAVPKTEEKNATGPAAADPRPPRTASRRRNMEDSMGSSSTAGSAAGNARGTNADASHSFSNSFRSFPSGLGGRGGSRVPTPQQSAPNTAPFHADSSSPPPLHRPTKLSPEERLRRVKEAQRAEQEKQAEIQRRRDAEKALRRQREELREEQRRKREEERLAKEKEEQERSKREYERWQQEWEKEEQERRKAYAEREARHQHQEQGAEALLNDWKAHRQQSSLFSRQKPPRRTMSTLTSSSDLRTGNSPASWSPSGTPAEPGSPEYDVERSPDGSSPPHFFSSASSLTSLSQEWRLPPHRKGEHERDGNAFPSSSLGSVEDGRGAAYSSHAEGERPSGRATAVRSTWTPMMWNRPEKTSGGSGGVPRTSTNPPVRGGGRNGGGEEGVRDTLSSLFHSAHPESGVPRVIRRPGYPSSGQDSGTVAGDPTSSAYVIAQKRGVVKRSAPGAPPSFMASPQDDRSPTLESSEDGEGEGEGEGEGVESLGSTPPGGSPSDSLKAPPLSDVERNLRQLRRERLGTEQGGKNGAGGGTTPAFSFRANEAKFQELENQFRQFSCTRSRRASVEQRRRSGSFESDPGEAEGSPFGRTTPGRPFSSVTRTRMRSAQSAAHRTHSPLSQRDPPPTGLLFPGSSQRLRPPSYSTAEHKSSPVKGGGLGSAHYLEDESSLIREERQLAKDRQRVEELLYNPMTFARGVSSRRNSRQGRRDSVSGEGEASSSQSSSSGRKPATADSTPLLSSDASQALPDALSSTPLSPPSPFTRSSPQAPTNAEHTAASPPKKKTSTTTVAADVSPIMTERPPPPPPSRAEELTDEEGGSELQQLVQEEHTVRVHEVENVERIALRSILRRFPKIFADIPLLSATSPSRLSREPLDGRGNVSRKSATMEESKPSTPALWKDSVKSRNEKGKEPPPTDTLSPPKAPPNVPVVTEEEKRFWERKKAEVVQSEMHFRNIIARSQHSSSAFMFLYSAEKLGRLATIALDQWERRKLAKLASLEYYQSMKNGIESSTGMQREKWVPLKGQDKKMMKDLSSSVIKILPASSQPVSEKGQSEKTSQDGTTHSPQGKKNKGGSGASASPRKDVFIASNTKPQSLPSGSPPSVTEKRNLRKVSGLSKEELADAATLVAQTHMQPLSPPAGAETDVPPGPHHSMMNTSTHPFSASPSHSDGHASSCHSSVGSSNGVHPKAKPTISLQRSPEDEPNTSSSSLGHSAASLSGSTHPSSLTAPLQQSEEQTRRTVENEEATLFCSLMQSRAAQLHAVYQKEKENAILAALTALRMKEEKSKE